MFLFSITLGVVNFARADIAVVVNPQNEIDQLSLENIKRIFNGTLRSYPSTGKMADALDQPFSSLISRRFYKQLLNTTPSRMKRRRAAYIFSGRGTIPEIVANDEEVKAKVVKEISAIGFIDGASIDDSVRVIYILPE